MNEASPTPQSVFTPEQLALLNANTIEAIRNGFAERYASDIQKTAKCFREFADFHRVNNEQQIAKNMDDMGTIYKKSAGAELPFVFTSLRRFRPNNTDPTDALGIARIHPDNGRILLLSPIPLIANYNIATMELGFTRQDFLSPQDAEFGLRCLQRQLELGMGFHPEYGYTSVPPTA